MKNQETLPDLEKTGTLFLKSGYFVHLKNVVILFALTDIEDVWNLKNSKIKKNSNDSSNKVSWKFLALY